MSEDTRQLATMLVPVSNDLLLVPGTMVAEIINWQDVVPEGSKPDWYLGSISWRGLNIPVVSFERANAEVMNEQQVETRLAVINCIGGNKDLPFYAIPVQGIPRTLKLGAADISAAKTSRNKNSFVKQAVKASGASASIPDFEKLEDILLAV